METSGAQQLPIVEYKYIDHNHRLTASIQHTVSPQVDPTARPLRGLSSEQVANQKQLRPQLQGRQNGMTLPIRTLCQKDYQLKKKKKPNEHSHHPEPFLRFPGISAVLTHRPLLHESPMPRSMWPIWLSTFSPVGESVGSKSVLRDAVDKIGLAADPAEVFQSQRAKSKCIEQFRVIPRI